MLIHHKSFPFSSISEHISAIDGWLSDREALFLYASALRSREIKGNIVEIGSWKGKSTVCLAWALKGTKKIAYAVDPHEGIRFNKGKSTEHSTYPIFRKNLRKAGVLSIVKPIVKTSVRASRTFQDNVSLLFIDGLHDYGNSKQDCMHWEPFLSDGGTIAFHDAYCGTKGVFRTISELFEEGNCTDVSVVGSIIYAKKNLHAGFFRKIFFRYRFLVIRLFQWIFRNATILPLWSRFLLCHRIDKVFLYTPVDIEMRKQSGRYIW